MVKWLFSGQRAGVCMSPSECIAVVVFYYYYFWCKVLQFIYNFWLNWLHLALYGVDISDTHSRAHHIQQVMTFKSMNFATVSHTHTQQFNRFSVRACVCVMDSCTQFNNPSFDVMDSTNRLCEHSCESIYVHIRIKLFRAKGYVWMNKVVYARRIHTLSHAVQTVYKMRSIRINDRNRLSVTNILDWIFAFCLFLHLSLGTHTFVESKV